MRSREQFKAYVYAKAEAELARGRKRQRKMICSVAACCVCVCVLSAVFLMPQHLYQKSGEQFENDFAAQDKIQETGATLFAGTNAGFTATEADATNAGFDATGAGSGIDDSDTIDEPVCADDAPILESCLFSAKAFNSTARTAFYEILSDPESAEDAEQDGARADVRIGVTAYYLKKPDISEIRVDYSGEAVTVTVYADAEPPPSGAYVYYFTRTLDGKKYFGQPIRLEFKTASESENTVGTK